MFELLTMPMIEKRIKKISHTIIPETWWSGEKKRTEVLEIFEPGAVKKEGYQPKLITEKRRIRVTISSKRKSKSEDKTTK